MFSISVIAEDQNHQQKSSLHIVLDLLEVCTTICTEYSSPRKVWFGSKLTLAFTDADQLEVSSFYFTGYGPPYLI